MNKTFMHSSSGKLKLVFLLQNVVGMGLNVA